VSEVRIFPDMTGKASQLLEGTDVAAEDVKGGVVVAIGGLPGGMTSGKTSVGILAMVDGEPFYLEMSLKMLQLVASMLTSKYGDETGTETGFVATLTDAEEPDQGQGGGSVH
jgi:hypothetical protein